MALLRELVPTLAPLGKVTKKSPLVISTSLASSLSGIAPQIKPLGETAGISFIECTAISICPSNNSCSISLVKKLFKDALLFSQFDFKSLSPLVTISLISKVKSG